jgi:cell division septation protein DedD
MDINYKQDQFELFPGATPGSSGPQPQPRLMFSSITLSGENIIVLTVFTFLAIIVSFSVGVEKGKREIVRGESLAQQKVVTNTPVAPKPAVTQRSLGDSRFQKVTVSQTQEMPAQVSNTIVAKNSVPVPSSKVVPPTQEALGNFYTVQVASFKKQEFADQEAQGLKKKGYETFVVAKGQHLILCAGRFSDQSAAKVFSGKLKSKYKDCLVRRL